MSYLSKESLVGSLSALLNERTNTQLIFLNVGSIMQFKLPFFGCVVLSNLYLLHEILLNPCLMFSKNLMLLFIEKATTGT